MRKVSTTVKMAPSNPLQTVSQPLQPQMLVWLHSSPIHYKGVDSWVIIQ
jgi:hypothetical protein